MTISGHVYLRHPYLVVIIFSAMSRSIINLTSHLIFPKCFVLLFLSFFCQQLFLHNYNVMTGGEMYEKQSNNY